MMEISLGLVDHCIKVNTLFIPVREYCEKYICSSKPTFEVTIIPEDIAFERKQSARERALEGLPPYEYSDAQLEITAVQRKIAEALFDYNTIVFHGSCIAVDGVGYLFTAKSGTGKSTHTRLWRELFRERAVMVDDDKPFLHISGDGVTVYGTPWNGKHRLGNNISLPLGGICLLERGAENRIEPVRPSDTLGFIVQQTHRPPSARKTCKYLELLNRLTACMRFWRMECNMDPQAAVVSYEAMSGKRKEESDED